MLKEQEKVGKKLEETTDIQSSCSESRGKGGGEESRRQTGRQRKAPVLTWRDGTESDSRPHLLPEMEQ